VCWTHWYVVNPAGTAKPIEIIMPLGADWHAWYIDNVDKLLSKFQLGRYRLLPTALARPEVM